MAPTPDHDKIDAYECQLIELLAPHDRSIRAIIPSRTTFEAGRKRNNINVKKKELTLTAAAGKKKHESHKTPDIFSAVIKEEKGDFKKEHFRAHQIILFPLKTLTRDCTFWLVHEMGGRVVPPS